MSESSCSSSAQESGASHKRINALNKAISNVDLDGHDLPPSPAPSTPRHGRQYAIATELVFTEGTDQYNASSVPIYQVRGRGGGGEEQDYPRPEQCAGYQIPYGKQFGPEVN